MKTKTFLTGLFALFCVMGFTQCSDDDSITPIDVVATEFQKKYPNASKVEWENKTTYVVADFYDNNLETEAWFDLQGTWIMTKTELAFTDLPQTIQSAHQAGKYSNWKIDDIDKLERAETATVYVIEVEQGETEFKLYYVEDGTLIKEIADNNGAEHIPSTMPEAIQTFIKNHYDSAVIEEYDLEYNGIYEVDIYHHSIHKDVYFKSETYDWIRTDWDIRLSDVPANVLQAFKTTPQENWTIDDIELSERPTGLYYVFETEQNDQEVYITIKEDGSIQ